MIGQWLRRNIRGRYRIDVGPWMVHLIRIGGRLRDIWFLGLLNHETEVCNRAAAPGRRSHGEGDRPA
jgi:hypothetical protein